MKFAKITAVIAVLFATAVIGTAQATPLIYSTTGTIINGTDENGVFGIVGSLVGAAYSMSLTMDSSQLEDNNGSADKIWYSGVLGGTATQTVTVNGVTKIYMFGVSDSTTALAYAYATPGTAALDSAITGETTNGQSISMEQSVTSYADQLLASIVLTSPLLYQTIAGDDGKSFFYTSGTDGFATFNGTATSYAIQLVNPAVGNDVPEPAPLALLGVGLVALAATRRKTSA